MTTLTGRRDTAGRVVWAGLKRKVESQGKIETSNKFGARDQDRKLRRPNLAVRIKDGELFVRGIKGQRFVL